MAWTRKIEILAGFVAILAIVAIYMNLPERVEKVEERVTTVEKTFDGFMMEQRTIQKEQNKREELMLKLLER